MKHLRFLICAVILGSGVTRAADPQPASAILDLPRDAWWGGPAYYAQFPRAAASGWTDPAFFPLAVFFGKPQHAAALKAAGVNTYMGAEHDGWSMASITDTGMYVLAQDEWTPAEVGNNDRVVGWHAADEPDMMSTLAEQTTNVANLRSRNDGRFIQSNYGNGVLGTFWDTTANPMTGHVALQDVTSVDKYAYTSPAVRFEFGRSPYWPLGEDGAQCSAAYGWMQERMEAYMSPVASKPNWVFVETAMPYLTEQGARTIGLEEFEGAVWNAIIHGAAGIAYFQHNNNGLPGYGTYSIIECPAERTAKITAVNAQVTRLAPVLNTQPYQWSFGTGLNTSLRVHDGYAYIFAMIAGGTGTGARTFTLPAGISAASVEVIDEGRTLTVTGGAFTDSFAAEHEHHIYRVIISPTAPAIAVQPADRTVNVGQTATFSVTATGAAPLAYQWQKNSADIAGATAGSYNTPATVLADSGSAFRVIVTNTLGSVTSSGATLTVLPPDLTPPVVSLTAPAAGATVANAATVSADASDNVAVAGVQFKLDGASLGAEDTSAPYAVAWDTRTAANGSHTLTAVARDAAGNTATAAAVTLTVANSGVTIFTTQTPASVGNSDGPSVNYELGTRFTSSVAGQLTAIRFWKDAAESGTHTGRIWSAAGTQLAAVTFTGETASGWQVASLATPLTIAAATEYTVSVNTAGTYYVATNEGLAAAVVNGPLRTVVGDNGVYGSVGAFPSSSWQHSNYFRDVVFVAGGGGGNNPPVIDSVAWADPNPVTLPAGTTVHVVASDPDGDPLTYAWTKVSGAGTATFATPTTTGSGVTFSAAGTYVLRVTVADGKGGSVTSDASVTATAGSGVDVRADLNHDGVVNALDLQVVIANFGQEIPNLPPLWNASPPTGVSPAPSGPVVGVPGQFDTGTLATNEVWDNFDGAAGSNPDGRLWLEDTINQGGTQVYDPAQSFLDGNGNAVLETIKNGSTILSGRFTSRTKFNMKYGWCAARIKFPRAGRAWFPAFWLLFVGYNTGNPYGEIDMMEFFGNTNRYSTHVFFGQDPYLMSEKDVPDSHSGGNAGDGFHTYWMQWEPDRMWIGVDDLVIGDWNPDSVPAGYWDHMRQPFYFIANFAVAPSWLPAPDPADFPARMLIDWIWYKPLPAP